MYSNCIVEQIRISKIRSIFNLLDSDGDGLISPLKMNIDELSEELFRVMFPLINEIEKEQLELNFDAFSEGMQNFI